MLQKVISGGQTGVDQSALSAAKEAGFITGGWLPAGSRTLLGPQPHLVSWYGLSIHPSREYPPRTEKNVLDSDGTLRIAQDFQSSGERCTLKFLQKHDKPYLDVQVSVTETSFDFSLKPIQVYSWILQQEIKTLNVAGNSERTCPGIYEAAKSFLLQVFQLMNTHSVSKERKRKCVDEINI